MNAAVVDASVAIKWVIQEPGTSQALKLASNHLYAPALWRAECANILWKKVRRDELSPEEAAVAAGLLEHFNVDISRAEPSLSRVLHLAVALGHPAYDCVYLALAETLRLPLVTADEKLLRLVATARSPEVFHGVAVLSLEGIGE